MRHLQIVAKGMQAINGIAPIGYPPDLVKELPFLIEIMGSDDAETKAALSSTVRNFARSIRDDKRLAALEASVAELYAEAAEQGLIAKERDPEKPDPKHAV
jgi:hypothetical protein